MTHPSPPPDFGGGYLTHPDDVAPYARATGPYRAQPVAVAVPRDPEDVARLVRWSADESIALIPRGAGTGMPGGNVGRWVVLWFGEGFRWIDRPDPETRTVRVGAAAVASHVQSAAASAGLDFPPLPSSARWATIGGMVAAGAAGARSFGQGAIGAWVEAVEVVLADGSTRVIRRGDPAREVLGPAVDDLRSSAAPLMAGWPAVRKNASGYRLDRFHETGDLVDLLVGSEGTLALVTAVTLRLRRPQPHRVLAVAGAGSMADVEAWSAVAREAGTLACEFIGPWLVEAAELGRDARVGGLIPEGGSLMLIEIEGDESRTADTVSLLRRAALELSPEGLLAEPSDGSPLWGLRRRASPTIERASASGLRSMQFIEDSVIPTDALAAYVDGLSGILAATETAAALFGHAGDANVHVNPLIDITRPDWVERVRQILTETARLVAELGGTLSGEHGDGRVRAPFLETIWGADATAAFRAVKNAFDPDGRLNPGVVLPLPGQDPLETISPEMPLVLHG